MRYLIFFMSSMSLFAQNLFFEYKNIKDEREWITKTYLPSCSGSMLYIGVGPYTTQYPYMVKDPSLFETIDFLEERAHWGSPYKHYVSDIMLFEPEYLYDNVSFLGILGSPSIKHAPFITEESMDKVLKKVHTLVKVGGSLQVAANFNKDTNLTVGFWLEKFKQHYDEKYKTMSLVVSPLTVIWQGEKFAE